MTAKHHPYNINYGKYTFPKQISGNTRYGKNKIQG
jgi:hypothetical protein